MTDSISAKLWSDEGCTTSMISYDEVKKETDVTCICDHLTSFAVLMVSQLTDNNNGISLA